MITCKTLRDAFFGHHREEVFAAIPDLPEDAFGACRIRLLVPYGERAGIIPKEEIVSSSTPLAIVVGVSHEQQPRQGEWMEEVRNLGEIHPECTLKETILADCMIHGNRYGCAWFIGMMF